MKIHFILSNPAVPENIGSAARAMKTMGFDSLRLVNPCEHLDGKAKWVAHGSYNILENAKVFTSLKESISDIDFIIGTSIRKRVSVSEYHTCNKLPQIIEKKGNTIKSVALVFGSEESGLSNNEIEMCDIISSIPLKTEFPSLNLAQSVMIYSYTLSCLNEAIQLENMQAVNESEFVALKKKAELILNTTKVLNRPALYKKVTERLNLLNQNDVRLAHSVCSAIIEEMENR